MAQRTQSGGTVVVAIDGQETTVARLVLEAFIGPSPETRALAHHIDGDPSNNSLDNLEWWLRALTPDDVRAIRERYLKGLRDQRFRISQQELADEYDVPQSLICQVINVGSYRHVRSSADRSLEARQRPGANNRGSKHGCAKLTENDVISMRRLDRSGMSSEELARRFGVTERHVRKILDREMWKHV